MSDASPSPSPDLTDDFVLGGRLKLLQPKRGHRVGHDAILLAAATDADGHDNAIDRGAGVGAAGLALARRVAGVRVHLVEIDPALAALAADTAIRNGVGERVRAHVLDVEGEAAAFMAAGLGPGGADRVLMNPPFHDGDRVDLSPDLGRRRAHVAGPGSLSRWISTASQLLCDGGVLTLIYRADALGALIAALAEAGLGDVGVLPVHPKPGLAAIRVILRAVKASRAPLSILPGLTLEGADGRPSEAAEAILREGVALTLSGPLLRRD
jgi:tRNA1(Val) A37 N6-methylase TrmN6